jgi:Flp pilus assembly pilin Flp
MARAPHTQPMGLLSRFCADRTGATAVEFGLIAFPFFALLFVIIQTAMVLFGGQALQAMTSKGARKIMTGEMKGQSFTDFKNAMCPTDPEARKGVAALFDCDKLLVQVASFDNFSDASVKMKIESKCFKLDPPPPAGECYKSGTGKNVVIVRVAYDWPFAVNLDDLDHKTRITAVAAFRNEPF